jgi:hypothetical protein
MRLYWPAEKAKNFFLPSGISIADGAIRTMRILRGVKKFVEKAVGTIDGHRRLC